MKLQRYWLPVIVIIAFTTATMAIPYLIVGRLVSPLHLWRLGIVGSTAAYIFSFIGVLITYHFSKFLVEGSRLGDDLLSRIKAYLICVGVCGLFAYGMATKLGTHIEDEDPALGGGGEIVVDYVPTDNQRVRHGLTIFFCLCIPSICGIYISFAQMQRKRIAANHRPLQEGGRL